MFADRADDTGPEGPAPLIDQFLRVRGFDRLRLSELPPERREKLLAEASVYASGKLVEVEARSHFVDEIHDDVAIAALRDHRD